jgi:hypothetical protein
MAQVERLIPDCRRIVYFVDDVSTFIAPQNENFEAIQLQRIGVPRYTQLVYGHSPTGVCCILKPYAVQHAIRNLGVKKCIYFDNDISLYRTPTELISSLERYDFVITPHITTPIPQGTQPDERIVQQYGIYNAGMFACTSSPDTTLFLSWWGRHMLNPINISPQNGWDQIWLAFADCFIEHCKTLRNPGYNVASWNLHEREITEKGGGLFAADSPLTTMHFSGFNEEAPERLFRPEITCTNSPNKLTSKICLDYHNSLTKYGMEECKNWGYGYSKRNDGSIVTDRDRAYFLKKYWGAFEDLDPFDSKFYQRFAAKQDERTLRPFLLRRAVEMISRRVRSIFPCNSKLP